MTTCLLVPAVWRCGRGPRTLLRLRAGPCVSLETRPVVKEQQCCKYDPVMLYSAVNAGEGRAACVRHGDVLGFVCILKTSIYIYSMYVYNVIFSGTHTQTHPHPHTHTHQTHTQTHTPKHTHANTPKYTHTHTHTQRNTHTETH